MEIVTVTKENFDAVIASDKPVLLDFWAVWCGPCRMVAPILEEIASERDDVIIGKVDVDNQMELAVRFGIVSIPTLIVMKNGEIAGKLIGYRPKEDILKLIG